MSLVFDMLYPEQTEFEEEYDQGMKHSTTVFYSLSPLQNLDLECFMNADRRKLHVDPKSSRFPILHPKVRGRVLNITTISGEAFVDDFLSALHLSDRFQKHTSVLDDESEPMESETKFRLEKEECKCSLSYSNNFKAHAIVRKQVPSEGKYWVQGKGKFHTIITPQTSFHLQPKFGGKNFKISDHQEYDTHSENYETYTFLEKLNRFEESKVGPCDSIKLSMTTSQIESMSISKEDHQIYLPTLPTLDTPYVLDFSRQA